MHGTILFELPKPHIARAAENAISQIQMPSPSSCGGDIAIRTGSMLWRVSLSEQE
jgi:hypothetical protein